MGTTMSCQAPDTGVVGEDHLVAHSESVSDRRVVVVEVAHEMLEQHDRRTDRVAEAPVGEADPLDLDEPCRPGVVHVPVLSRVDISAGSGIISGSA